MSLKLNSSGGGSVTLQEPVTASTLTLNLPAFSGTAATLASVTNNGVLYVNSSGQPTSGSALTFDGALLGVTAGAGGEALRLDSSGSTYMAFRRSGVGTAYVQSAVGGMYVWNQENTAIQFGVNNAEQMRLTSTGLLVGTTSNGTGAKTTSAGGVGITNPTTGRFATVEYGSGASGTFSTITISFTVNSINSSVILETQMTGFSGVFMDRVDAQYSNQAAVVMRNNSSGATGSFTVNGAITTYTLTISTTVTHPVVKVKATVGGLGTTITLPTITFA